LTLFASPTDAANAHAVIGPTPAIPASRRRSSFSLCHCPRLSLERMRFDAFRAWRIIGSPFVQENHVNSAKMCCAVCIVKSRKRVGEVGDVAVDMRRQGSRFGKWQGLP
jgi:hypothetical protein